MAIGQAVIDSATVADGSSIDIQPTGTENWVIHNILVPEDAEIELYFFDGSTSTKLESVTGSYFDVHLHVKNAKYYKVKNVSGGSIIIGYDGVITYE